MERSKPIQRRTPIARGAPPKRSGPIKAKPRPASETRRIYGSKARVAWVKSLPCAGCNRGPCINAHTESGGTGRKADHTTIIPLCERCHRIQHDMGWEALMLVHPKAWYAKVTELAWQDHQSRGTDDE